MKYFFALILIVSIHSISLAQFQDDIRINIQVEEVSVLDFINQLEVKYDLKFRYKYEWIENFTITATADNEPLSQFLERVFKEFEISQLYKKPYYVVLIKDSPSILDLDAEKIENNKQLISLGRVDYQLTEATISGKIRAGEDDSPLPGVTIISLETGIGTVTDPSGNYKLTLPVGFHILQYKSLETGTLELSIVLNSSSDLNLKLYKDFIQLKEVQVTAKNLEENVNETVTGVERLTLEEINKLPAFLGEVDIIKSITSLPGVNLTGEAAAGFNVRGSGPGANLVLLDNGTIFNSSHLFGVFTAFNADVIGNVELYKGAVPAKYGGRIASVLNIEMKDGNKGEVTGGGGVGVISSRFYIETPIVKKKSALVTSIRAAYPNYLINAIDNPELEESSTFFGDFSLKYDHLFNENNQIEATIYGSNDQFSIRDETTYIYNNLSASLQWNHVYNANLSSELNYNYSQYNYSLGERVNEGLDYSLFSVIENNKLNMDFTYSGIKNNLIEFGINNTYFNMKPGDFDFSDGTSFVNLNNIPEEEGIESAVFISDEIDVNNKISAYIGLRYSFFNGGGQELKESYQGFEPRFSVNYKLNNRSSIKLGYNRMRQYIHLISNTAAVTPIDVWKLSNAELRPSVSDQISLGYFRNFNNNYIETSIEAYYKRINDLVEYKNGADLFGNANIEEELLQGNGDAYGIEFYIKKNRGKATGWLSYTYSRSLITVEGESFNETINKGNPFPTNFDQPHNLSLFGNWEVSRRFQISMNFLYNTGRPITYPQSIYSVNNVLISNYNIRNGNRIPDYHRLDLSFHLGSSLKKQKNIEANWTLTLYNVYSRRNAYSVFFRTSESGGQLNSFRLSIIGQIIPALSYNFKF